MKKNEKLLNSRYIIMALAIEKVAKDYSSNVLEKSSKYCSILTFMYFLAIAISTIPLDFLPLLNPILAKYAIPLNIFGIIVIISIEINNPIPIKINPVPMNIIAVENPWVITDTPIKDTTAPTTISTNVVNEKVKTRAKAVITIANITAQIAITKGRAIGEANIANIINHTDEILFLVVLVFITSSLNA